jgi:hypothetical protein
MPGPDTELNRMCRKVGDVVEVLPNGLSEKARKEINDACGKIAEKAKTKADDIDHFAKGEFDKISKETLTELAELAKDVGKDHTAAPLTPAPKEVKPIDLESLTKKGERFKLSVPIKFSNQTDVYLFLNYDKGELLKGNPTLFGTGAGFEHKFTPDAKLKGEVLIDTSQQKVSGAGFIKLEVKW